MSMLRKPYEISLWEDRLNTVTNKFEEVKIIIIGTDTMDSQSRAISPKLVSNINGTNTFTFDMYYRYKDNITGEMVDNPFCPFITNERKLKLKYDGEWYDLLIKSVKIDSTKQMYSITATDQYINELSRNGFNFEFDPELSNNIGSAEDLAEELLKNTDWEITSESEFIPDLSKEALVELVITNDALGYTCYQIHDDIKGGTPTRSSISAAELFNGSQTNIIYGFYSCCQDKASRFQFIYLDGIAPLVDDERIIANTSCQYFIDHVEYSNYDPTYGISIPNGFTFSKISSSYRGARYKYSPTIKYNPILEKYVTIYTKNNQEYHYLTETEYIGPNLIKNIVTNPNTFKSTSGWKLANRYNTSGTGGKPLIAKGTINNEAIRISGSQTITMLDDLKAGVEIGQQTYVSKLHYKHANNDTTVLYNTGFFDNRSSIDYLQNGQQYIIKMKASWPIDYGGYIRIGSFYFSDEDTGNITDSFMHITDNKKQLYITSFQIADMKQRNLTDNVSSPSDYRYWRVTIQNADYTENTFKKQTGQIKKIVDGTEINISNKIYITLPTDQDVYIEDFQIFPYVENGKGGFFDPEDQLTDEETGEFINQGTIITHHKLYRADDFNTVLSLAKEDIKPVYNDTKPPTGYTVNLSCRKRRAVTTKESNYFNILQTICETFECWAEFKINHDSEGHILAEHGKQITFRNFIGQDNFAGFRYGVNLKSIQRTDDSKQIVTKLIVKQNSNEFGKNGICTITRAASNETGENYIYNLDYYINQGLLNATDWTDAIYGATNKQGFYPRLRTINNDIEAKSGNLLSQMQVLNQAEADLTLYENAKMVAEDGFEEAKDKFFEFFGFDWNNKDKIHERMYITYKASQGATATTALLSSVSNADIDGWYSVKIGNSFKTTDAAKKQVKGYKKDGKKLEEHIDYLVECSEFKQAISDYTEKYNNSKDEVDKLKAAYKTLKQAYLDDIETKTGINEEFYRLFYRFIQEGTWNSEDYHDDELYYLDALSTLYNSCMPKVSYSFSVLELSQLEDPLGNKIYEGYTFKLGDRTFVEDTEYFGYDENGNPCREEVVLTEMTYNFDEPEKNSIKVQNYKNQFQDLFKRITATVQAVHFATGAYDKAAALADANDKKKSAFLQAALNDAGLILQNLAEQTVRLDAEGLTIIDGLETNKMLRAVSKGILLTDDGGNSWKIGITADGIAASILTSGTLNTGNVNIMYGMEPTFRWDRYGITAYGFDLAGGDYASNFDRSYGVRFDRYGIYGFQTNLEDGSFWHPNRIVDWVVNSGSYGVKSDTDDLVYIRNKSTFELTREGFYLKLPDIEYKHYRAQNGNYGTLATAVTKNTLAQLGRVDDLIYNSWSTNHIPYYDSSKSNNFVQIMRIADDISAGNKGTIGIFSDGTIIAKRIYVYDEIGWSPIAGPQEGSQNIYYFSNELKLPTSFPTLWVTNTDQDTNWFTAPSAPSTDGNNDNKKYLYKAAQTKIGLKNADGSQNATCSTAQLIKAYPQGAGANMNEDSYAALLNFTAFNTPDGFYYETSSGKAKLYISATYINTGTLTVSDGHNTVFSANIGSQALYLANFKVIYGAFYTPNGTSHGNSANLLEQGGSGINSDPYVVKNTAVYIGRDTVTDTFKPFLNRSNNIYYQVAGNSRADWKLIIGNNFGVTSNGTIYATGAVLGGYATTTDVDTKLSRKNTTYYQASPPNSSTTPQPIKGDLWIDSDDNKLYRYQGDPLEWVEMTDNRLPAASKNSEVQILYLLRGRLDPNKTTTPGKPTNANGTPGSDGGNVWVTNSSTDFISGQYYTYWTTSIPAPQGKAVYYTCTQTRITASNGTKTVTTSSVKKCNQNNAILDWCTNTDQVIIDGGFLGANTVAASKLITSEIITNFLTVRDRSDNLLFKADSTNKTVNLAGFTIGNGTIYSNSHSTIDSNFAGVYIGTDGICILATGGQSYLKCNLTTKVFEVKGTIIADAGVIGGCSITSGMLYVPAANITGTLSADHIEANGLQIGATQIVSGTIGRERLTNTSGYLSISSGTLGEDNFFGVYGGGASASVGVNCQVGGWSGPWKMVVGKNFAISQGGNVVSNAFKATSDGGDNALCFQTNNITIGHSKIVFGPWDSGPSIIYQNSSGVGTTRKCILAGTWEIGTTSSSAAITSDINLKNSIKSLDDKYEILFDNLEPISYKYNDGNSNRIHTGFISQQVETAIYTAGLTSQDFAAFVKAQNNGQDIYCLRYDEFISLNTWQIQKLKTRTTNLEEYCHELETRIAILEAQLNEN